MNWSVQITWLDPKSGWKSATIQPSEDIEAVRAVFRKLAQHSIPSFEIRDVQDTVKASMQDVCRDCTEFFTVHRFSVAVTEMEDANDKVTQ